MDLFVFEKTKEFYLPVEYDRNDKFNFVTGVFTTDSIRFYKNAIESIITLNSIKEKNPELTSREILMKFRALNMILESFRINESGKVEMRVDGTKHKDKFSSFEDMILVKGENFTDVTSQDKLHDYLERYGFDEKYESEIIESDIITLHRNPSRRLSFKFE